MILYAVPDLGTGCLGAPRLWGVFMKFSFFFFLNNIMHTYLRTFFLPYTRMYEKKFHLIAPAGEKS